MGLGDGYIKAKFIGTNGSMGLKKHQEYKIQIETSRNGYIHVSWFDALGREHLCPYTSVATFKENWG